MPKPTSFLRVFTETGPLVVLAVAIALLILIAGPASAQFFNFGGFGGPPQRQAPQRGGGGWFGGDFFAPFQQQQQSPQAPRQDFSRAPGPAKRDTVAERNVLVLGDAMSVPEARLLLRDLTEHATQREFVHIHKWTVHDLVMWDNRQTMHRVRRYDQSQPRDMRRATVAGTQPTVAQQAAE